MLRSEDNGNITQCMRIMINDDQFLLPKRGAHNKQDTEWDEMKKKT